MSQSRDPSQSLALIRTAHLGAAVMTWGTGLLLAQIVKRLYDAIVADQIRPDAETMTFVVTIALGVYAFLHAVHGALMVLIARWIRDRVSYDRVYLMAAVNGIIFPVGTLLFVLTAMHLSRPGVKELFSAPKPQIPES